MGSYLPQPHDSGGPFNKCARRFHARQHFRISWREGPDGKTGEQFLMTFAFPDGRKQIASVDRTVGSRRMEQYLTKEQGQYTRLPLAYDLVNRRWMSLNGSFLSRQRQLFSASRAVGR